MKEYVVAVTSRGRITIPAEARLHLGISAHDKLTFVIEEDGRVRVKPATVSTEDTFRSFAANQDVPHGETT